MKYVNAPVMKKMPWRLLTGNQCIWTMWHRKTCSIVKAQKSSCVPDRRDQYHQCIKQKGIECI